MKAYDDAQRHADVAADELKRRIYQRTRLEPALLVCPREKSAFTPCVARDGQLAAVVAGDTLAICVGCEASIDALLEREPKPAA